MTHCFEDTFIRERVLVGETGLNKLNEAKVAVCGLGGVGSYLAEALVRSAVGHITLIDFDQVAASNINRQLCALHSTTGRDKADVVAERIADINPHCRIRIIKDFIDESSDLAEILADIDYIGDAIDHIPGKIALISYAYQRRIPIISSMGAGRRLDPSAFKITDISKTYNCPLAKTMRKKLREIGITHGVNVVFSTEAPLPPAGQFIGSIAFVPPIAGLLMAGRIVRDILAK